MNVFNPALVARAFVYITFPIQSTAEWVPAAKFSQFPGGLLAWLALGVLKWHVQFSVQTPLIPVRL